MSKFQRILCMMLSAILLLTWMPASLAEEADLPAPEADEEEMAAEEEEPEVEVEFPEELIVGHPTITKGDFFTEMFGNDTADIDVRALIHGYNLVNWDQNQGTYVFDPSVVREVVKTIDELGNHRYNLVLADNLYYSDGTHITAWDYAFSLLLMMSPEIEEIGGKIYRAEHLIGYDDYIRTRRKIIAGEELATGPEGDVDYLSGVRVISDYQIEFRLNAEFLPYFFEIGLMMTVPYPISVIAPGCKVVSGYVDEDGNPLGIKIVNEDESNPTPIYTADLLRQTILDPETGYNTFPSVVSGPYVIKSWDGVTGHFEINEQFKGAWMENNLPGEDGEMVANDTLEKAKLNGHADTDKDEFGNEILVDDEPIWLVKPTIEKIAFTVADNDTMIDELAEGNLHLINKVTYTDPIQAGFELRGEGGCQAQNYPRIGLSFLTFTYEWPTVNDMEVRQAIAWCMDREGLTARYCGGQGLVMDGYYGFEQWEYKLVTGRIGYPVNFLPTEDYIGTPISEEQEEENQQKKKTQVNMWAETQEEYDAYTILWEKLAERWQDEEGNTLLVHYTVDLDVANKLLDKSGWVLNKNGEAYRAGVDEVRCKKIDDAIVPLELKMMYPAGNHMIEFMQEEGMFVDNLAQVGIKLEFVPKPMEELLRSYYREEERTTDMIYLATNFHVIVDPAITYYNMDDDSSIHKMWNNTYSDDKQLYDDAVSMQKTEPGSYYEYVERWMTFQERYNEVLPTIPIYSNIYYDFFSNYLQNYNITNNVTWSQAIIPAYFGLPEVAAEEEEGEEELADDEMSFD